MVPPQNGGAKRTELDGITPSKSRLSTGSDIKDAFLLHPRSQVAGEMPSGPGFFGTI